MKLHFNRWLKDALGCVQTDAKIVDKQLPALLDVTCCVLFSQQLPTFLLFRDRRSVAQQNGSGCTALPTLLGPRTLIITHGLQRLMGCILPRMHYRSQQCWELLYPFAHHCQHERNSSQHCWRNNVGSCCVRLHAALVVKITRTKIHQNFLASKYDIISSILTLRKSNLSHL